MEKLIGEIIDWIVKNGGFNIISAILTTGILAFIFAKFFLKIQDQRIDKIEKMIENQNNNMEKLTSELNEFNKTKYIGDFLIDNYSVFKNIINAFSDEIQDIFSVVLTEINYCERTFIKNYINGSHRDKAIETIEYASSIIIENMSNSPIDKNYINIILAFNDLFSDICMDLILQLEKMNEARFKASLINKYFENLKKVISYSKVKIPELKSYSSDEIKDSLLKYFYSIDITNKLSKVEEESSNKIFDTLSGFKIKDKIKIQECVDKIHTEKEGE